VLIISFKTNRAIIIKTITQKEELSTFILEYSKTAPNKINNIE